MNLNLAKNYAVVADDEDERKSQFSKNFYKLLSQNSLHHKQFQQYSLMNFNNGNLKHRNEEKCAKKTTHSIQDLVSKENGTSLNGSAFSSTSLSNFTI